MIRWRCWHRLPCDATQIGRFRAAVGEQCLAQMLKATINAAVGIGAVKPEELERVIVDTTVQDKAIAHPVDSRLLEIARHKLASAARRAGLVLKQTCAKEGKTSASARSSVTTRTPCTHCMRPRSNASASASASARARARHASPSSSG